MARRRDGATYLFHDYDLEATSENQRKRMLESINSADPATIRTGDIETLVAAYVAEFALDVPELIEGAISVEVEEAQVDVRYDQTRFITDRSRPFYMPGIRATYYVPYHGDQNLFLCKPNRWSSVIPAVTDLRSNELVFAIERPDENVDATKRAFEADLARVKEYLGWARQQAERFNESLPADARNALQSRRDRLTRVDKGVQSLGVPIRRQATTSRSVTPPAPRPSKPPVEKYDVALSFAGEDRAYVEQVALGLKEAGISVFYDDFEKVSLWGKNLVDHLADIYTNRSRYVVMFISRHYVAKAWPTHERQHAQARALVAKDEYILPVRFDDTEVPGMTSTVSYVPLTNMLPSDLVSMIQTKIKSAAV